MKQGDYPWSLWNICTYIHTIFKCKIPNITSSKLVHKVFSWPVDHGCIVLRHLLLILNPLGPCWILWCLLLEHFWERSLMLHRDASFGHPGRCPRMNFHMNEPSWMPGLVNFWADSSPESGDNHITKLACLQNNGKQLFKVIITHI